jgi:hypothetical protein
MGAQDGIVAFAGRLRVVGARHVTDGLVDVVAFGVDFVDVQASRPPTN